jgi:hypothetical protein
MADAVAVSAATISLGQTVTAYSFFLPPLREVRKGDPADADIRGDVLLGQIAAGSLSLAVGVLLSWMTSSPYPVYTALFIALVIAATYQAALRQNNGHPSGGLRSVAA